MSDQYAKDRRRAATQRVAIGRVAVAKAFEIGHKIQRETGLEAMPVALPGNDPSQDVLAQIAARYRELALQGDDRAAEILVRIEERMAKARGTDAPHRMVFGIDQTIERLSDGIALANLSSGLRRAVVAELEAGEVIGE